MLRTYKMYICYDKTYYYEGGSGKNRLYTMPNFNWDTIRRVVRPSTTISPRYNSSGYYVTHEIASVNNNQRTKADNRGRHKYPEQNRTRSSNRNSSKHMSYVSPVRTSESRGRRRYRGVADSGDDVRRHRVRFSDPPIGTSSTCMNAKICRSGCDKCVDTEYMSERHLWNEHRDAKPEDFKKWNIPMHLDAKYWDPDERPVLVLNCLYSLSELGEWICMWSHYFYNSTSGHGRLAGQLWISLIEFQGLARICNENIGSIVSSKDLLIANYYKDESEKIFTYIQQVLNTCSNRMKYYHNFQCFEAGRYAFIDSLLVSNSPDSNAARMTITMKTWNTKFRKDCSKMMNIYLSQVNT